MYKLEEKDWRLFKKMLPIWQERFLDKTIEDYKTILNTNDKSSKKFWDLSNRMIKDKKNPGVILRDLKRDEVISHLLDLLKYRVISESDLDCFSISLQDIVKGWRKHIAKVDP